MFFADFARAYGYSFVWIEGGFYRMDGMDGRGFGL
jgi:hypothetical protein